MPRLLSARQGEDDVIGLANVKTVLDVNGYALYFSRAMIPHNKKGVYDAATHYWRKLARRGPSAFCPTAQPPVGHHPPSPALPLRADRECRASSAAAGPHPSSACACLCVHW